MRSGTRLQTAKHANDAKGAERSGAVALPEFNASALYVAANSAQRQGTDLSFPFAKPAAFGNQQKVFDGDAEGNRPRNFKYAGRSLVRGHARGGASREDRSIR